MCISALPYACLPAEGQETHRVISFWKASAEPQEAGRLPVSLFRDKYLQNSLVV